MSEWAELHISFGACERKPHPFRAWENKLRLFLGCVQKGPAEAAQHFKSAFFGEFKIDTAFFGRAQTGPASLGRVRTCLRLFLGCVQMGSTFLKACQRRRNFF